jgi:transposase-like protein
MRHYSAELKDSMVQKLCSPGGPSALQLSKSTGISQTALSRWKRQAGGISVVKDRRPQDWTPEEKLKAVFEAASLNGEALGEFLRKNGLHSSDLEAWKKEALSEAAVKKNRGRPRKDPELVAALEENKQLKRDVRRKEKALAEQTALVILQKKVQELWGKDEDDE